MASDEEILQIKNINKVYRIDGEDVDILKDINLNIKKGEFVSIVGHSGCGKSTLLRLITGLEDSNSGEISIAGETVVGGSNKCGMIFQEARLFPWMNVSKNIGYGIREDLSKAEAKKLIDDHINLVALNGFEKARPRQLSGGMQQRVSIARALIGKPELLLLDEPFGALDAFTRITMQNELLKIWKHQKCTMILVTHDIDEAIYLSDRIVIMSKRPGKIKEIIDVDLPRPRDRSNQDFMNIRKRILISFLGSSNINIEYYI